ncbi:MAG: thymidylate synthase [Limisphaerales bacterium]
MQKEVCLFRIFEGQTADETWRKVASAFRRGDGASVQASRGGSTLEILHAVISISDPRQRWVVSREPSINLAFALAEIIWIMAGRNDSAFLNYFNHELPRYAGHGLTYHGAYGYRLRRLLRLDQLERAYEALSRNPESRQVVLQIWDGAVDLPALDGLPVSEDIPCNIVAMLKVRDGSLEWTEIMRSNDIFRGLPYNFVQFTAMQEIVAGWLGLKLGSYNHVSDSLHVYERDLDKINPSEGVCLIENMDSLALPKAEFDVVFAELERQCNAVTDEALVAESLVEEVKRSALPASYRNILCVLSAEGMRRRKQERCIDEVMSCCTNQVYQQIYTRWRSRVESSTADT